MTTSKPWDWHWFDHPEMQARIAAAEADREEGRVERFDSREEAIAFLDSLAHAPSRERVNPPLGPR